MIRVSKTKIAPVQLMMDSNDADTDAGAYAYAADSAFVDDCKEGGEVVDGIQQHKNKEEDGQNGVDSDGDGISDAGLTAGSPTPSIRTGMKPKAMGIANDGEEISSNHHLTTISGDTAGDGAAAHPPPSSPTQASSSSYSHPPLPAMPPHYHHHHHHVRHHRSKQPYSSSSPTNSNSWSSSTASTNSSLEDDEVEEDQTLTTIESQQSHSQDDTTIDEMDDFQQQQQQQHGVGKHHQSPNHQQHHHQHHHHGFQSLDRRGVGGGDWDEEDEDEEDPYIYSDDGESESLFSAGDAYFNMQHQDHRHHHHHQQQQSSSMMSQSSGGGGNIGSNIGGYIFSWIPSYGGGPTTAAAATPPPAAATTTTSTSKSYHRHDDDDTSTLMGFSDSDGWSDMNSTSDRSPSVFSSLSPRSRSPFIPSLLGGDVEYGNDDIGDNYDNEDDAFLPGQQFGTKTMIGTDETRRESKIYDDEDDEGDNRRHSNDKEDGEDSNTLTETTALVSWHREKSNSASLPPYRKSSSKLKKTSRSSAETNRNGMKVTRRKSDDAMKNRSTTVLLEEGYGTSSPSSHGDYHRVSSRLFENSDREHAIEAVRGQLQPPTARKEDRIWLCLFVVQLVLVCIFAAAYGQTVLKDDIGKQNHFRLLTTHPASDLDAVSRQRHLSNLLSGDSVSYTKPTPRKYLETGPTSKSSQQTATATTTTTTILSMEENISGLGTDSLAGISTSAPEKTYDGDDDSQDSDESDTDGELGKVGSSTDLAVTEHLVSTASADADLPQGEKLSIDYKAFMRLVALSGVHAIVAVYLGLAFMMVLQKSLVIVMLMSGLLLSLCWSVFGFTLAGIMKDGTLNGVSPLEIPSYGIGLISSFGLATFALTVAYTISSWNSIGFGSTNLYVAICAIRGCGSVFFVGIVALFIALCWILVWSFAFIGIITTNNFVVDQSWLSSSGMGIFELVFLSISFFWTLSAIQNALGAYVSRAIGSWWKEVATGSSSAVTSDENPQGCCGGAKQCWDHMSMLRECFGTVCFGSMIFYPIHLLNSIIDSWIWLVHQFNDGMDNPDDSEKKGKRPERVSFPAATHSDKAMITDDEAIDSLSETTKLISSHRDQPSSTMQLSTYWSTIRRKLRTCNRWAWTYVGMYNYSFLEGGEKAIQLFETRGWMGVVDDSLIFNILLMGSVVIGGSTGAIAVVVEEVDGSMVTSLHKPVATSFWIGLVMGFVLSNMILFGIVGSAVKTVLVLFAAEPLIFHQNHPQLSREMREVWSLRSSTT